MKRASAAFPSVAGPGRLETVDVPLRERVPLGPLGPIGVLVDPRTWRAVPYLLVSLVFGLTWFLVVALGSTISVVMMAVWIGFPLLLVTVLVWRGAAMLERRLLRLAFGVRIRDPYRRRPERGVMNHLKWLFRDPATWRDLGYLMLLGPLSLLEFVVVVVLGSVSLGLIVGPFRGVMRFGEVLVDTMALRALSVVSGFVLVVVLAYAVRGLSHLHGMLAATLLGGGEEERLRASRARGIDAAEAERRRIERDLHDGAQLMLLSVAMDLGRARTKLDDDPEQARELIAQAHTGTRAAIAELRDLARGIHPAILTDRGLDAALSALAARAPISVDAAVDVGERPPAAVESIAYYIVAESLANMAKHAAATEASVRVVRAGQMVTVEIWDNGIGGAVLRHGGGLAGLADRAATIDGMLVVNSPVGGPTLVRAELPCEW
ncbi:sensor histidine kinase [Nonomuraea sp. NPDC050790]|uniref:sensor histidine kinase n=1 Tax=Nonomuraea sp. NPDC050790 TaxID=3364371 RepID=UPI00378AC286